MAFNGGGYIGFATSKSGRILEARKYSSKALSRKHSGVDVPLPPRADLGQSWGNWEARKALYQALSQNPYFESLSAVEAMKMVQELGSIAASRK